MPRGGSSSASRPHDLLGEAADGRGYEDVRGELAHLPFEVVPAAEVVASGGGARGDAAGSLRPDTPCAEATC